MLRQHLPAGREPWLCHPRLFHREAALGAWADDRSGRTVVAHGFENRGLARIYAFVIVGNDASARVLEKVGMKREGILRSNRVVHGDRVDDVLYAVLREEWEA